MNQLKIDCGSEQNSKEEVKVAKKSLKRYLTSLAIREMQIKTASRFHHIPVR